MSRPDFRGIHREFLDDTEHAEIDLEGARYSGKSWVCTAKVIESCLKFPGINWLACRYSNEETKSKIRPLIEQMAFRYGVELEWNSDQNFYAFPERDGKISKLFAHGLKAQTKELELAKVRGLEMAGIWNDQAEETPQIIVEELPFGTRQDGYPHQLIFSPNPPPEDHFLTDRFPEENPFPHRRYYRVGLHDNEHNLPDKKIAELEADFPSTHAKHRSLILGLRGVNVAGVAVYHDAFLRARHVVPVAYDPTRSVLEAIHSGQQHPMWLVAQRTYFGGWNVLGGVMGKRMFLTDFLPIIDGYRQQWFPDVKPFQVGGSVAGTFKTCCDPPPNENTDTRYTSIPILRSAQLKPVFRTNASAHDVREAVIQDIAGQMKRSIGEEAAFKVNTDPDRWLMVSKDVTKRTRVFVDGLESSYVWDDHMVSVSNKKMRQPKTDEWTEGAQRCLENIVLNFGSGQRTDAERDITKHRNRHQPSEPPRERGEMDYCG